MGYTTDFDGCVTVSPPLSAEEVEYLNKFSETRRMDREKGPYYVDNAGQFGQDRENDIRDYNRPPSCQPGLWCQWVVSEDGSEISWNGCEKFYDAEDWMAYIIEHFVGSNPVAKQVDPSRFAFLQGHTVEGDIFASGEESGDLWKIEVRDNVVTRVEGHVTFENEMEPPAPPVNPQVEALARTRITIRHAREEWDKQVTGSPHLNVSRETFEIFLRDLEEASGIR